MFKTAVRAAPRRIVSSRTQLTSSSSKRLLSTAPPTQKSRGWKSATTRWGLAAAGVYYYNTSNLFAEEPEAAIQRLDESIQHAQDSRQPTIDAIVEEKRQREAQTETEEQKRERVAEKIAAEGQDGHVQEGEEEMEGLEAEADQQGAFNPETGEINWDCPCLGGMAHGPCGEEFKAAFSCFVYSNEEPKGVECIEKFKGMQDCFRQHPEMYGSELEDDEDEVEEEIRAQESEKASSEASAKSTTESALESSKEALSPPAQEKKATPDASHRDSQSTTAAETQKAGDEGGDLVPKASYDATSK